MQHGDILENKTTDHIVTLIKSFAGIIPSAGTFIGELVTNRIPNQRIDRIAKFATELDKRLDSKLNHLNHTPEMIDFSEEILIAGSKAKDNERQKHILNLFEHTIKADKIEFIESTYLLNLLSEINDIEVIILIDKYNSVYRLNTRNHFRQKHEKIFEPILTSKDSNGTEKRRISFQNNYKVHLENLGLLESKKKIDHRTNEPKINKKTGNPQISNYEITSMGKILVETIIDQ
ncbi:hypothetical protein OAT16_06810 [Prolixibacteraceae bacterium]|nr:hypothetical protein [Prolixibacteraceae bacterium]